MTSTGRVKNPAIEFRFYRKLSHTLSYLKIIEIDTRINLKF